MKNLILTLLIFCLYQLKAQEKPILRYEGSSTISHFIKDAGEVYNNVEFEINAETESSGGENSILNGTADIGGVARIPSARVLGKGAVSTLIGWDAIAIVVNNNNPVKNLTKEQLKGIFTNKITNWKELGGFDKEIRPYIVSEESATRYVCRSAIMGQEDYIGCETVSPDSAILSAVAGDEAALGQISFSFLNKKNKGIKTIAVDGQNASVFNQSYPITRPLYLLWWPGRKVVADFVKWTQSAEAQQIIMNRFIGKVQETVNKKGKLIVYSKTEVVEEGGAYFYPHESYKIYSSDGQLLQQVKNNQEYTDENPTTISLEPGQYLIWTSTAEKESDEKLLVNIEADQTTKINTGTVLPDQLFDKVQIPAIVNNLKFYGDFRFRGEQDWNSKRSNGTFRDDRGRLRYRLRIGFNYKLNEQITFGGRLRSGNFQNQQSPHITFGENPVNSGLSIDKAYFKYAKNNWSMWMGKNNFPFWKQNEMWWDDDVMPEGIAFSFNIPSSNQIKLFSNSAYFVINDYNRSFERDPKLIASQLVSDLKINNLELKLGLGYFFFDNMPDLNIDNPEYNLDYNLLVTGFEFDIKTKLLIILGIDYINNLSDLQNDSLIVASGFENEKQALVLSLKLGSLSEKGKVLMAYYYSRVEKYAVVPFLAQDDWVRWSFNNSPGTRSSNFGGHELRLAYAFDKGFNVVARAYFSEGLIPDPGPELETGSRFRLDFNLKF